MKVIESSDKEEPLTKMSKVLKKRNLFRWRWYTLGGTFKKNARKTTADRLGTDDTSAEDQKSVNEVRSFNNIQKSHRLRPYCKLL